MYINIPKLFPTIEILDFNYFVDIANVWGVDYDSSLDNSKVRSSTGVGLNVLTLSVITNFAAGIAKTSLSHEEVLFNAKTAKHKMIKLLSGIIDKIT